MAAARSLCATSVSVSGRPPAGPHSRSAGPGRDVGARGPITADSSRTPQRIGQVWVVEVIVDDLYFFARVGYFANISATTSSMVTFILSGARSIGLSTLAR